MLSYLCFLRKQNKNIGYKDNNPLILSNNSDSWPSK